MNDRRLTAEVILQIDTTQQYEKILDFINKFTSESLEHTDHNLTTGSSVHKTRIVDQKIKWLTVEDEDGEEMEIEEFEEKFYREVEESRDKDKKDTKG